MGPEQMQQVADLLREGSGELVEYIKLCAWFQLAGGVILLITAAVLGLFSINAYRKIEGTYPSHELACTFCGVGAGLSLVFGIMLVSCGGVDLINPVGAAVKMLVQ